MFIEARAQKHFEAPEERHPLLCGQPRYAPLELKSSSGEPSYKHLAALRPTHDSPEKVNQMVQAKV
jgi:hypothetical protein